MLSRPCSVPPVLRKTMLGRESMLGGQDFNEWRPSKTVPKL
jgi:hypothetical protein